MRRLTHTLLAAVALGLLAAAGAGCASQGKAADGTPPAPSPDTLALVEGLRLYEEGAFDDARDRLRTSARSGSAYIRAESHLYLNALEMELGNYDVAHAHLDRYHAETIRMLRSAADLSHRMEEQTARLRHRGDALATGMIALGLIAISTVLFFARRQHSPAVVAKKPPYKRSKHALPDTSKWEPWLECAGEFKRTPLWDEIAILAAQTPGRDARVVSLSRQQTLDAALAEHFADMATSLRSDYPALTVGDVKLCCLSLLPLSPFGRALCFGSTETNIIKQRKHTIKKKLSADARGQALFDFIFSTRKQNTTFVESARWRA